MAMHELEWDELEILLETAQWVPFTPELQKKYTTFAAYTSNPMFSHHDGVYMVKNGSVVDYASENGHFWGEFDLKMKFSNHYKIA
jgi:hypothetical protein